MCMAHHVVPHVGPISLSPEDYSLLPKPGEVEMVNVNDLIRAAVEKEREEMLGPVARSPDGTPINMTAAIVDLLSGARRVLTINVGGDK